MANDRIFIVCDWCGSHRIIGKYYPGSPCISGRGIGEFYETHFWCHPQPGGPDLGPEFGLSLLTEEGFCNRGGVIGDPTPLKPLHVAAGEATEGKNGCAN